MDKIYSRKRIKVPKIRAFYLRKDSKIRKFTIFIIVIIIAIFTFWTIMKSINPIFYGLCLEKVRALGTKIVNEESSEILNNTKYDNIVSIMYDTENNTKMLKTDVVTINKIASDIAVEIEDEFQQMSNNKIEIPIGSLTGNKYFAGIGPSIKINIIPTGNVITELKTEFQSQGINQTMYRIYLELKCKVNILTPYKTICEEITNQVLLVETLVVGNVPETYYDLNNMSTEDSLNLIE